MPFFNVQQPEFNQIFEPTKNNLFLVGKPTKNNLFFMIQIFISNLYIII